MGAWTLPAFYLQTGLPAAIWRNLQLTAQQDDVLRVTFSFLLAAAVLAWFAREQRRQVQTAVWMFGLAVLALFVGAVAAPLGLPSAAKTIHAVALLVGGFAIVKLASIFVFDVVVSFTRLSPPQILRDVLVALGYVGVGLSLLSRGGVSLSGIVATSAIVTAAVVFSLQDSLSNLLGGLLLQTERTIGVGDWVQLDQTKGRVKELHWRYTVIETRNWDTVIVPNSMIMKSQVLVQGRRSGRPNQTRRWLYFNVDFRVAPTEVIRVVTDALLAEPMERVAVEPKPNCILWDFKESYCQYAVRYWLTDLEVDDPTDSLVRTRVYFALQRAGISLSVPAHTIFVEEQSQARKELHQQREIQRRLAALNLAHVELFEKMNEEERSKLAERLRPAPFTKGEVMTRQGAEAHWLYVITKGSAEVLLSVDGGASRRVAVLEAGDVFGEISLLTGERRTASVKALEDVECYRLDREAFHDILSARPEIAQHLAEVAAKRQVELETARQDLDAAARSAMMQHHQRSIFDGIYKIFRLGHTPKPN